MKHYPVLIVDDDQRHILDLAIAEFATRSENQALDSHKPRSRRNTVEDQVLSTRAGRSAARPK